jgi:hypothetical protein
LGRYDRCFVTNATSCIVDRATATRAPILSRIPPLPHSLAQDERALTVAVATLLQSAAFTRQ